MTFAQWLSAKDMSDIEAGAKLARHRTHIYKLRTGSAKPSYDLMLAICALSGGKVPLDSWQDKKRKRLA